jgi:hypothetical protein
MQKQENDADFPINLNQSISDQFLGLVLEMQEIENGYRFRLPLETSAVQIATNWIINKRLCLRFLRFALLIEKQLWLELTGIAEAKEYVRVSIVNKLAKKGIPTIEAAF